MRCRLLGLRLGSRGFGRGGCTGLAGATAAAVMAFAAGGGIGRLLFRLLALASLTLGLARLAATPTVVGLGLVRAFGRCAFGSGGGLLRLFSALAATAALAVSAAAAVATAALLLPSLFLLTAALTGLARWKRSRFVQGLLWGVKPATNALILKAGIAFAGMSVWSWAPGQAFVFRPCSLVLAVFAGTMLLKKRLSVMATIFLCAAAGALCWGGLIG